MAERGLLCFLSYVYTLSFVYIHSSAMAETMVRFLQRVLPLFFFLASGAPRLSFFASSPLLSLNEWVRSIKGQSNLVGCISEQESSRSSHLSISWAKTTSSTPPAAYRSIPAPSASELCDRVVRSIGELPAPIQKACRGIHPQKAVCSMKVRCISHHSGTQRQ